MTPDRAQLERELRQRAERRLAEQPLHSPSGEATAQRLLHELQVHQVELQLQYEELLQARADLERALKHYTALYDFAPVGYLSLDGEGRIRQLNVAAKRLLGLERANLIGRRFLDFLRADSRADFTDLLQHVCRDQTSETRELALQAAARLAVTSEVTGLRTDRHCESREATAVWIGMTVVPAPGEVGEYPYRLCAIEDITHRKAMEKAVRRLALHDPLTDLPNRRLLMDRLHMAIAAAKRSGEDGALIFIDLDNFKVVNDKFGHDAGDELLVAVAHRLQSCIRESDTVARFGGDELLVLIPSLGHRGAKARIIAEELVVKVQSALCDPHRLHVKDHAGSVLTVEHRSTGSIGVALFSGDDDAGNILRAADRAMYEAKEAGRNTFKVGDCQRAG